jgi:hypothetical protein
MFVLLSNVCVVTSCLCRYLMYLMLLPNIWNLAHLWRMYQLCLCCIFVPYSFCSQDLNMYLVFWFLLSSNVLCLLLELCFWNTAIPVTDWINWLMPSNRNFSFPGLSCTLRTWLEQLLLVHCHHCYVQSLLMFVDSSGAVSAKEGGWCQNKEKSEVNILQPVWCHHWEGIPRKCLILFVAQQLYRYLLDKVHVVWVNSGFCLGK